MLPTFIIGLREGLEAALIVGIVAAFLVRQGRRDAVRQVWVGVGIAVAACLAIGVLLNVLEASLPQRGQESLETAADALAKGSARALVVMALLAVFREGFETAVFLLATFQASTSKVSTSVMKYSPGGVGDAAAPTPTVSVCTTSFPFHTVMRRAPNSTRIRQ